MSFSLQDINIIVADNIYRVRNLSDSSECIHLFVFMFIITIYF